MKRLATAAIAILVVLLITQYSPGWLFATIVGLLSALMLEEYLNLGLAAGRSRPGPWFLIPGALIAPLFWVSPNLAMLGFSIMTLGLAASCVFDSDLTKAFDRLAVGLSGLLYCCLPISFLTLYERKAIYVLFAIIWAGDSCAYYGGRALGRHKLSPRVSPNKTVEGAVSGLVGSVVAGTLFGMWLLGLSGMTLAIFTGIAAIVGQIGDLAESALERSAGVKDSSSILPGHGGILDRLDSLLFAAPVFFWLLNA